MTTSIANRQLKNESVNSPKVDESIIVANGAHPFLANQSFGGFKATDLDTPTDPNDAANKAYVDASGGGGGSVSDLAYDSTAWNGVADTAPSQNAVRDFFVTLGAAAFVTPTTVGLALVTLANPSAIRFIRVNADNTVTALDAATFRTAIGAGTSSFSGAFSSLTGIPTTLAGYGIVDAQPLDGTLTALAGLIITANSLSIGTGADAFTQVAFAANTFPARSSSGNLAAKAITDYVLTILDDPDAATVRATIGLGNVDNTSDVSKPVSTAQQAAIDAAVVGLWDFKGNINCSANPNYPAALKGDTYVVSVAGKIGGASGIDVGVGDVVLALADNAGGTQASVGTSWSVLEVNIPTITTVGNAFLTIASPSAIRYTRINADNTVSLLDASTFVTAIGAQPLHANLTGLAGLTLTGNGLKGVRVNSGGTAFELAVINAATVTIASSTTNASHRLCFVLDSAVPGDLPILTHTDLHFNPFSGLLTVIHMATSGDLFVAGELEVVGDALIQAALTVGTTLFVGSDADVSGNMTVDGTITVGATVDVIATGGLSGNVKLQGVTSNNYVTMRASASTTTYSFALPTADGTAGQLLKTDGSGNWSWASTTSPDLIILEHQEAQGTNGGTFTLGADRTAPLNTEITDTGGHCTLSSNQFTLAAGTYRIRAWTGGFDCSLWRSWLYNTSDSAIVLLGGSAQSNQTEPTTSLSFIDGTFTIAGTKTFEIRKRSAATSPAGTGYGVATNFAGVEVYTRVILQKVA